MAVVPCFNEDKRIGKVLQNLKKQKISVVVVDDGSKDNSFAVSQKYTPFVFRHKINLGKGAALKTGCDAAVKLGAEGIVILDSDGQHEVDDFSKFSEALQEKNVDVVFGSRNLGREMPLIRSLGNKFGSFLISSLFGIYVSDLVCGYRAFTANGYKKIRWESSGYGIETEMVINVKKQNLTHCEVPIKTVYYDKFKGVTILDALSILGNVIKWRLSK